MNSKHDALRTQYIIDHRLFSGISLKANCRGGSHNRQAKKRPTHLKLYYSGTESSCSPKSNSTSTSVSTGTSSAASPGLESPALTAGKMFHSHSSPRGGGSPRTPRSPRIKLVINLGVSANFVY